MVCFFFSPSLPIPLLSSFPSSGYTTIGELICVILSHVSSIYLFFIKLASKSALGSAHQITEPTITSAPAAASHRWTITGCRITSSLSSCQQLLGESRGFLLISHSPRVYDVSNLHLMSDRCERVEGVVGCGGCRGGGGSPPD